jgi:membrane-associated phospholipid phosphatase
MKAKHDTTPYKGHYGLYVAAFIVAIIIFALGAALAISHKPTGWEMTWFRAINNWSDKYDKLFALITILGTTWMALASVVVAFIARFYRLAWRLALTICGAYGVVYVAKHVIGRDRPLHLIANAHVRASESGMGFPSGHATVSTVIALTLLPYLPRKWQWVPFVFIIAVGLSRIYLGVHLPLDVIGGFALGAAAVAFIRILPQSLRVLLRID